MQGLERVLDRTSIHSQHIRDLNIAQIAHMPRVGIGGSVSFTRRVEMRPSRRAALGDFILFF